MKKLTQNKNTNYHWALITSTLFVDGRNVGSLVTHEHFSPSTWQCFVGARLCM